ncbi:helix-turn-helix domain-containing protein [Apibacter raozihei]|uniref:helix-turn-helix domain-containing protein n=1 Tax=Apibacter raozihei TaxID=2500547 RepID=UPI000FE3DB99|nr:helix-turn-helix domain-containing protein [Apibacter raozihei]
MDLYQPMGHGLVFHPDLIRGTILFRRIKDYTFSSYLTHEALHLSAQERSLVLDCFANISRELLHGFDKHSKRLIASHIELFLNYCECFYDRQFITRENVNKGTLQKFKKLLNNYYTTELPLKKCFPSVAYCADQLHLSSNYFGDLIKKEMGKSAQEYIQNKIIKVAKDKVFDKNKTINEIAYELGFKYPQHFSRLFKSRVSYMLSEYIKSN